MPYLTYSTPLLPHTHWQQQWELARLLFIDYSSAFNTIVPIKLASKLTDLGLNSSLCDWIQDFLTGQTSSGESRPVHLKLHHLNVGAPQGCVLSPLLYSSIHTWLRVLSQLHIYYQIGWWYCGLASFPTMMRPHTWMRVRNLHHGARTTVSLWMCAKLKSWLWTSERDTCGPTLLLWSCRPLWRG